MTASARTIAIILLVSLPLALFARGVDFQRVELSLSEDGYILLDSEIGYDLNETVSEALENGVPLTFEIHVQMRRAKAWIWEADVVEHRLRTVLRYRPLSGLYELRNLAGEEKIAFATRDAALRALGRIVAMPIVLRETLALDQEYLVRIDARLDVEALPLPMRPRAYLDRDWSIEGEPWEWRFNP